jgi:spermidine synthase
MAVYFLFFLSGAASLILETVFRRQLALFVGSAVTATSLTLALFLGGLALGAAAFGRMADRSDRPLRLYGRLELGAGVLGGLAIALLTFGREALFVPVRASGGGAAGSLLEFAIAAAILLPPTILMGGTLPALARHAALGGGRLLGPLATLYGVNTLGASLGAAVAGFVLFEALGVAATGWMGASIAVLVGVSALLLDRAVAGPAAAPSAALPTRAARDVPTAYSPSARRAAMACAAMGGAAALGYEIVWTRLLALPLRSYAYSFSLMLSLFLLGLVAGSLILATIERRIADPLSALAIVQLAAGAWVAASVVWLPSLLAPSQEGSGFGAFVLNGFLKASPVVLPPTLLSGMALPLAVRVFSSSLDRTGAEVGAVYAANTLGAIAGAVATVLALLPAFGASRSLGLLAGVGAAAGAIASASRGVRRTAPWAAFVVAAGCGAIAFVPSESFTRAFSKAGRTTAEASATLFYREGATDTVAVVRRDYGFHDPEAKSVLVNGIAMTATVKPVWRYMAAEGHLPALFAPPDSRALVICVGTGITLGAVASHDDVAAVDAVDLSESVLAALPVFARENDDAFRAPNVRLIQEDGRHELETRAQLYGLITLEPPPPIVAGSVHLYTLDFYRLCRRRLTPGGVVAQWLPLHAQSLASAQATARTFLEAFPHAQLWLPSIRDAVLIGSDRPLTMTVERVRAAYAAPRTRANLEAAYLESPQALLGTFLLDRDGIARWSQDADVITDDRPWMEFFRRYGRTMSDREIATLLEPSPGALDWIGGADPGFLVAVEAERRAHALYLRSEILDDPKSAREAAVASTATRFGRYRLGCDTMQLDSLRAETSSGERWRRQVATCGQLFGTP